MKNPFFELQQKGSAFMLIPLLSLLFSRVLANSGFTLTTLGGPWPFLKALLNRLFGAEQILHLSGSRPKGPP